MSCNGCRVLRKGCSEACILRPSLQWIDSPEAQGYATVFLAKFFGRAGLISFISAVPEKERSALFQSLLYEACGRTVNPISGAVGLLWTGKWYLCQTAVDTVLRGGTLHPISKLQSEDESQNPQTDHEIIKRRRTRAISPSDLDLSLSQSFKIQENWELGSPSMNSEESVTTCCDSKGNFSESQRGDPLLLNLFT